MTLVFNGAVKRLAERSLFAHNQGMFALESVSLRPVGGPILEKAGGSIALMLLHERLKPYGAISGRFVELVRNLAHVL